MDIKSLLDLTCLLVSVWMKGKDANEIRGMFGLRDNSSGSGANAEKEERRRLEEETGWYDKP